MAAWFCRFDFALRFCSGQALAGPPRQLSLHKLEATHRLRCPHGFQCVVQVGDQIVDVLNPD